MSALITFDDVSAATPDGSLLFGGLTLALGRETAGLVGRNGCGKSTLLAIAAGERQPKSGKVVRSSRIAMLRQIQPDDGSVAEALNVADPLALLRRLDAGEGSVEDAGAADWMLEQRIDEAFRQVQLRGIELTRSASSLSGGERTRLGLAAMLMEEPQVLLMDEPTNNLDADGRAAIAELLDGWPGGALVASHDRELLERMDRIVQLSPVGIFAVSGGWSAFMAERDAARDRAGSELERAEQGLKQQAAAVQRQTEKKARRDKVGRAQRAKGSQPKILLDAQAERAEHSAARDGKIANRLIEEASETADAARKQVEIITPLSIDLPPAHLPANKVLLRFDGVTFSRGRRDGRALFGPLSFTITGPQRIIVSGPNGSGKTTLLRLAMGDLEPTGGTVTQAEGALALLDQHTQLLNPALDLVANLQAAHPGMRRNSAHEVLARFAFRNRDALRPAATLSGGERLRAGLAMITGCGAINDEAPKGGAGDTGKSPQMLVLDEPTNHLDIEAIEMLEQALANYDGALMIVSHERRFLDAIGWTEEIAL